MKKTEKKQVKYNPNIGFIGDAEVKVANYLFSAKELRKAYNHAKPIADRLMNNEISSHHVESKKLTKFLKNRDLTFSKKTPSGEYKTFTVPCTTTVVPLEKSLFNDVEEAAKKLMISLRGVLQDIYGAKDLESSAFINSLPKDVRAMFIQATRASACYYPQLHHKNMKDYPFLDNVGLDLVLIEDYIQNSDKFPALIGKNKTDELPGLPFKILEINAGSPSGASNNMNVLEGLYSQTPEVLNSLGKVMPNDHFDILGDTYKTLGESWTGIRDGIQIILPPGGQSGAAPEIHQLAAYSGLIYAEADQLYKCKKGFIRLRTVSDENPIVTAIYSRINSDSALFDEDKGLLMRDPDSAEAYYLRDGLILDEDGEGRVMLDSKGNPIPQQSSYAIPGAIQAILDKKLYMGGLNRILDNKIILATLTHYAPKFFAKRITAAGLELGGNKILPPQTLPPTAQSAEIIASNPDEWVVKAPSLAGGQGVYILKTMNKTQKQEILDMIKESPEEFAYQQLVKIARIPVAVQRKEEGYKFANLAADLRMWVFFGGGKNAMPQVSHNALVRYAPQEKGKMSSIVNTSAGGGYAPFVIVDDTNDKNAVTAKELAKEKTPVVINTHLPVFVAAQMVQISRMLKDADRILIDPSSTSFDMLILAKEMRDQLKEIISFLHPRAIVNIYKVIDILHAKIPRTETERYEEKIAENQLKLVKILKRYDNEKVMKPMRELLDSIKVLDVNILATRYTMEDKALDIVLVEELKTLATYLSNSNMERDILKAVTVIRSSIITDRPDNVLGPKTRATIRKALQNLCEQSRNRLQASPKVAEFASLFTMDADVTSLKFESLYLGKRDIDKKITIASQQEMRSSKSIVSDEYIDADLLKARQDWSRISALAETLSPDKKASYLAKERNVHLARHPRLQRLQVIMESKKPTVDEIIELMDTAPYAKFNIEHFAKEQGITVKEVFSSTLKKDRISLLTEKQLKRQNLAHRPHAGECFAKKKTSHGLYSDSNIYIWMRKDLNPFTMIYTAGHELIHYQQIKNSMAAEKRAIKDGGISIAKFLNYYGNFLGSNERTIEGKSVAMESERKQLCGYTDRLKAGVNKPVMRDLDEALRTSDTEWEHQLEQYGSLFGYMMESSSGTQVKALQEVLPALENAKNILFAQELGLDVQINAVKAAMPAANDSQAAYYTEEILDACKHPEVNWEALRIIASHQYHGVVFHRAEQEENNLALTPVLKSVSVGSSYNQTQQ